MNNSFTFGVMSNTCRFSSSVKIIESGSMGGWPDTCGSLKWSCTMVVCPNALTIHSCNRFMRVVVPVYSHPIVMMFM